MKKEHAVLGRESILLILTSLEEKKTTKCFGQLLLFIIWMIINSFKYKWIITVLSRIETIPAIENIQIKRQII